MSMPMTSATSGSSTRRCTSSAPHQRATPVTRIRLLRATKTQSKRPSRPPIVATIRVLGAREASLVATNASLGARDAWIVATNVGLGPRDGWIVATNVGPGPRDGWIVATNAGLGPRDGWIVATIRAWALVGCA